MRTERIDVITYEGRKGDERPAAFDLQGVRIEVLAILEHWIEEGYQDRIRKRFFTLEGSDGGTHRIFFNEEVRAWFYTSISRRGRQ